MSISIPWYTSNGDAVPSSLVTFQAASYVTGYQSFVCRFCSDSLTICGLQVLDTSLTVPLLFCPPQSLMRHRRQGNVHVYISCPFAGPPSCGCLLSAKPRLLSRKGAGRSRQSDACTWWASRIPKTLLKIRDRITLKRFPALYCPPSLLWQRRLKCLSMATLNFWIWFWRLVYKKELKYCLQIWCTIKIKILMGFSHALFTILL